MSCEYCGCGGQRMRHGESVWRCTGCNRPELYWYGTGLDELERNMREAAKDYLVANFRQKLKELTGRD